jgi:hypothetical protein
MAKNLLVFSLVIGSRDLCSATLPIPSFNRQALVHTSLLIQNFSNFPFECTNVCILAWVGLQIWIFLLRENIMLQSLTMTHWHIEIPCQNCS